MKNIHLTSNVNKSYSLCNIVAKCMLCVTNVKQLTDPQLFFGIKLKLEC